MRVHFKGGGVKLYNYFCGGGGGGAGKNDLGQYYKRGADT